LGSRKRLQKIENAIRKLDVIPRQVLIEVNIFEVTLNNDLRYGVEWYFPMVPVPGLQVVVAFSRRWFPPGLLFLEAVRAITVCLVL